MIKGLVTEHKMRKLLKQAKHKPVSIYVVLHDNIHRRVLDKFSKIEKKYGNQQLLYYTDPARNDLGLGSLHITLPPRAAKIFQNYWHAHAYLAKMKQHA